MANPITLHTVVTKYPPNEEIIKIIRTMLKEAKEGTIQGLLVAAAAVDDTSNSENGRSNITNICYTSGWNHSINSAFLSLQARIITGKQNSWVDTEAPTLTNEDE